MPLPTLIQATNSAMEQNAFPDLIYNLPHPTLAGNCLILYVQTGAATTFTITDDGSGNVWTQADSSVTGGQFLYAFTCPNVAAGTQKITVTFGAAQATYQGGVAEFNNVATSAPVDVHGSANGSSTTASVGLTTGTAGDLIWMVAVQDTFSANVYFGTSFAADANGELIHAELWHGTASYWAVQPSAGAVTPTITLNPTAGWQAVAVALKSAAAGTPLPATPRVRRRQFSSSQATKTSATLQLPCSSGSLVVYSIHASVGTGSDPSVASITDLGNNNFFAAAAESHFTSGSLPVSESIWYSPLASSVTPIATVTWNSAVTEETAALYELTGCDPAAPLGRTATATGNQSVAGNLTAGAITPNRAGSIVVANLPIEIGTIFGTTSPSAHAFDGFVSTGMNGGFNWLEEDNGHGVYAGPDTSAQTWTWTNSNPVGGVSGWGVVLAEFMPPATPPVVYGTPSQRTRRPAPFRPGLAR
jgi:hypothetical protein